MREKREERHRGSEESQPGTATCLRADLSGGAADIHGTVCVCACVRVRVRVCVLSFMLMIAAAKAGDNTWS